MTLYSYTIGSASTLSGTVTMTSGASTLTSSTTGFSSASAGDYVTASGETRIIASVNSASSLTTTAAWGTSASGLTATSVRLVNLETLLGNNMAPRSTFTPYSQPVNLGSGAVRGAGWKMATWRWDYLSKAQRDLLRAYCTGASNTVYINTKGNDSSEAYALYQAIMIWPQAEERYAQRRLNFELQFRSLVAWP